MNNIDFNNFLNREEEVAKITKILSNFEESKQNLLFKKGIYIYGNPGFIKIIGL